MCEHDKDIARNLVVTDNVASRNFFTGSKLSGTGYFSPSSKNELGNQIAKAHARLKTKYPQHVLAQTSPSHMVNNPNLYTNVMQNDYLNRLREACEHMCHKEEAEG